MKLTYRGVSYEYNPQTVETTTAQVGGKYRGLDWRFRNLKNPPVLQPVANLTYRGVTYNKPGTTTTSAPQVGSTVSTQQKARSLMMNHSKAIKKRQQAMLSRLATEIGLDDQSGKHWSRIQGKIHPSFRAGYDRFGAAMS